MLLSNPPAYPQIQKSLKIFRYIDTFYSLQEYLDLNNK